MILAKDDGKNVVIQARDGLQFISVFQETGEFKIESMSLLPPYFDGIVDLPLCPERDISWKLEMWHCYD